jgi:hypothetical protein
LKIGLNGLQQFHRTRLFGGFLDHNGAEIALLSLNAAAR